MTTVVFPRRMAQLVVNKWWQAHGGEMLLRGKVEEPLDQLVDYIVAGTTVLLEDSLDEPDWVEEYECSF